MKPHQLGMFAYFDDMCWPMPCEEMHKIAWQLRYGDSVSESNRMVAAQIIDAYSSLVQRTKKTRKTVIRGIQDGMLANAKKND